jgi:DNA invertase Pin-like site-specific DNA recombinase
MDKVAILARVSTEEQKKHGISLDAQVARCQQYAEAMGFDVVYVGIEGLSGKDTDRPELQKVLTLVNKKIISHVLVVKLDRLSRDVEDSCRMGKLFAKKGVTLHLVTEGGPVDLTDPSQEMLFHMRASMGRFERRRISLNTKFALQRKIQLGEKVGSRAPYGFKFDGNQVIPCAAEQAVISRIRELNAEGFSERKIIAKLASDGIFNRNGKEFNRSTIRTILAKVA